MSNEKQVELTEEDVIYSQQMQAWLKEQKARERQIIAIIETSSEVVEQNKIQLEWQRKSYNLAAEEYEEWKRSKGIE